MMKIRFLIDDNILGERNYFTFGTEKALEKRALTYV